MDDVTNSINNLGKPVPQRRITISLTPDELDVIVSLAQNPSPSYRGNETLMAIAKSIFEDGQRMLLYYVREAS